MVHISERVLPGDKVRVGLTYYFTPSEDVKRALKEELKQFDLTVLKKIDQALHDHKGDWKSNASINPDELKFELLKSARLRDDTRTIPALLTFFGFKQSASTQRWVPTDETLIRLNLEAQQEVESGLLTDAGLATFKAGAKTCLGLLKEGALGETPQALIGTAARCLEKAASMTPPPDGASVEDTCQERLSEHADEVKNLAADVSGKAISEVSSDLGRTLDPGAKGGCSNEALKALESARSLLTVAHHLEAVDQAEAAHDARVEEMAAVVVVTAELADGHEDILEAEAERRGYSLSSGAVYLTRMNDLVYPVAVSVCPAGCLRGDEQFWFDAKRFARSLSAEIGVAAVTADNHGDARRRGGPGFLLGVSWQVLAPFKLSGGTLFFENQENRGWQFDGFVGVTLDAAKAVEMMGLLGIAVPVQLKSKGSTPADATSSR
ncbi:hypothetical protein [Myxococcus sp. Y35]|uniref:hypothetical protein n=1 Tax=Pseudomyxococcus flavus TaxID=3115648 RepID=UPI003CF23042